jgi:hypothetical protein
MKGICTVCEQVKDARFHRSRWNITDHYLRGELCEGVNLCPQALIGETPEEKDVAATFNDDFHWVADDPNYSGYMNEVAGVYRRL